MSVFPIFGPVISIGTVPPPSSQTNSLIGDAVGSDVVGLAVVGVAVVGVAVVG
eukprot:CAMPEP_0201573414 /NCGR_PEP_ID=MMETSP0190_2-20130828/17273_1 /ASSEMBLY_ACC=CAM_ASM_000263 /TAXON_ID=37353 /ORGANISM="Rosalina sp." /LENGTH=52 /DNA_ID=CAMNT_0048000383 /DNA_START=21 /DNA_END=175 /DNA_ORIENTATION=+